MACALHPDGLTIKAKPNLAAALETAARLIKVHPGSLFQTTFMHRGILVRVDVMKRLSGGGWHVAEMKSLTAPNFYHAVDRDTACKQPLCAADAGRSGRLPERCG